MASRTTKKSSPSRRKNKSWQDIDQSVKPKSRSSAAEKRVWFGRLKIFAIVIVFAGVAVGALQLGVLVEKGPELLSKAGESLPINNIEIETDGSLPLSWVERYLELDEADNLLSIDLSDMKARLEMIGQIESAELERVFPDTLRVSIIERMPVARLLVQEANGDKLHLYTDAQGTVFESKQMDRSLARSLPYVKGVALKRSQNGFSNIEEMVSVSELLKEAQAIAPHIYQTWRVVTPLQNDTVEIKNHRKVKVMFSLKQDLRAQLSKLDFITDYYRGRLSKQMEYVDLTLGDQVPVRSMHASR